MTETDAEYSNLQVPREVLADYRGLDFEPVAPRFPGYTVITTLIYWLPVVVGVAVVLFVANVPDLIVGSICAGLLVVALLVGCYRWSDAGHRGWALRGHDLAARQGIFWRSVTVLPFARIQHVETSSGPIERWRGLARLKLFTAGGTTADLTLIGLAADTADTLREHLAEQIRMRDAQISEIADAAGRDGRDDAHE